MPLYALLRLAAIASPIIVVAMSWLPLAAVVRTGIPHSVQHVLAYFGSSVLAKGAWPRLSSLKLLVGFTVMAAILETGQLWMPGRTGRLADFALGLLGVVLALLIGLVFDAVRNPEAYRVERRVSSDRPERSPLIPASIARAGLLSLLVIGGLLTLAWVASLIWAIFLIGRWLLD